MTPKELHQKYNVLQPEIFREVQELFGEKTGDYEFNGIEYAEGGPFMSVPEACLMAVPREYKININLDLSARENYTRGLFQLSHEVVHLLSPSDEPITNNLEEGAAVYFSKLYTERETGDLTIFETPTRKTGYRYAYCLVCQLLAIDRDAIKNLRKQQPDFREISPADFVAAGLKADDELITALLATFLEVFPPVASPATGSQPEAAAAPSGDQPEPAPQTHIDN
jgi:hypothetical protein